MSAKQKESWITQNWRPLLMLEFGLMLPLIGTGLINVHYLALVPSEFWTLLTLGIGGYITSRGAEKIIPDIAQILKDRKAEDPA